ncbi:hypothetical protein IJD44_10420 [bacterium]|nr:hypothetical protein [bacterium]
MARKPTIAEQIQVNIKRLKNFLVYARAYIKKNNPIKKFIEKSVATFNELTTIKKKLKKIEYRINYERYKLKKTELILAQNSEHLFLRGRSINQTR